MGYLDNVGLAYFWQKIRGALNGKQDTLTAGDGIAIEQQGGTLTISATGGGGGEVYSAEEKVIGTWIDGKPLYRKTVVFKATGEDTIVPSFEYEELTNAHGFGLSGGTKAIIPNASSTIYINGKNIIVYLKNVNIGSNFVVTFEYTKTTD